MAERIDYVKVKYSGNAGETFDWKERIMVIILDYCESRKLKTSAVSTFSRAYDREAGLWIEFFEVWGEAADHYFNEIAFTDRPNVVRIDYRAEIDRLFVRLDTIEHVVKVNRSRTRRTITRIDSPPRQKKDGRDAGGDMLAVGSKGSRRRVALYKRGNEPWALEAQFSQGVPFQLHQQAVDLYLNTEGMDYYTAYMKVAYAAYTEAVRDFLHYSFEQISGEAEASHGQEALDLQESFLAEFDTYWERLDDKARAVIKEKVIAKPDTYAIISYEPVEPDGFWEGHDADL